MPPIRAFPKRSRFIHIQNKRKENDLFNLIRTLLILNYISVSNGVMQVSGKLNADVRA